MAQDCVVGRQHTMPWGGGHHCAGAVQTSSGQGACFQPHFPPLQLPYIAGARSLRTTFPRVPCGRVPGYSLSITGICLSSGRLEGGSDGRVGFARCDTWPVTSRGLPVAYPVVVQGHLQFRHFLISKHQGRGGGCCLLFTLPALSGVLEAPKSPDSILLCLKSCFPGCTVPETGPGKEGTGRSWGCWQAPRGGKKVSSGSRLMSHPWSNPGGESSPLLPSGPS